MTTGDSNTLGVKEFIAAVRGRWIDVENGDAKSGNKKVRVAEKIVAKWAKDNSAFIILKELLEDGSPAVQLAAASHIINFGGRKLAVPVLRRLSKAKASVGLVSTFADAVLRVHKIEE